jgi:hypothetical protein
MELFWCCGNNSQASQIFSTVLIKEREREKKKTGK